MRRAELWRRSRLRGCYRPVAVIPIIGARKLSQFEDNLASIDLTLSADQLKMLDEPSRIELGFPHHFYESEGVRAICYGGLRDKILHNVQESCLNVIPVSSGTSGSA
jgi:hypothetical protein